MSPAAAMLSIEARCEVGEVDHRVVEGPRCDGPGGAPFRSWLCSRLPARPVASRRGYGWSVGARPAGHRRRESGSRPGREPACPQRMPGIEEAVFVHLDEQAVDAANDRPVVAPSLEL